jgi:hypothetical protein
VTSLPTKWNGNNEIQQKAEEMKPIHSHNPEIDRKQMKEGRERESNEGSNKGGSKLQSVKNTSNAQIIRL